MNAFAWKHRYYIYARLTIFLSILSYTGCEIYNLGTGRGTSVLEMVSAFEKASGKVCEVHLEELALF